MPSWALGTGSVGRGMVMVVSCWPEELEEAEAGAGEAGCCCTATCIGDCLEAATAAADLLEVGVEAAAGMTVTWWVVGPGEPMSGLVGESGSPWLWVAWCFFSSLLSL